MGFENDGLAPRSLIAMIVVAWMALVSMAQELVDELAMFEPLVGTAWSRRFQDHWVTQSEHVIEWEATVGGQVVRWSKRVEELGFSMETFFYWDSAAGRVAFVQFASNGNHGEGVVETEGRVLVLIGTSKRGSTSMEFKQTFEIVEDGTLEDRYFSRAGDGWAAEHVIVYCPI